MPSKFQLLGWQFNYRNSFFTESIPIIPSGSWTCDKGNLVRSLNCCIAPDRNIFPDSIHLIRDICIMYHSNTYLPLFMHQRCPSLGECLWNWCSRWMSRPNWRRKWQNWADWEIVLFQVWVPVSTASTSTKWAALWMAARAPRATSTRSVSTT